MQKQPHHKCLCIQVLSKFVLISDLAPPPPMNVQEDENSLKAKSVVISWETPPHADVYEISSYSVETKRALDNTAVFITEDTVNAEVTKLEVYGLEPNTEYFVQVVSHRKNTQKKGVSDRLEIKTKKGKSMAGGIRSPFLNSKKMDPSKSKRATIYCQNP